MPPFGSELLAAALGTVSTLGVQWLRGRAQREDRTVSEWRALLDSQRRYTDRLERVVGEREGELQALRTERAGYAEQLIACERERARQDARIEQLAGKVAELEGHLRACRLEHRQLGLPELVLMGSPAPAIAEAWDDRTDPGTEAA